MVATVDFCVTFANIRWGKTLLGIGDEFPGGTYYYFSVQFVGTVGIACNLYPSDRKLMELREGECDTDNLSPYPGIAKEGERMNHDEFMRRVVAMSSLDQATPDQGRRPRPLLLGRGPPDGPAHEGDELIEL